MFALKQLKYLPLVIPAAIAGMSIVSGVVTKPGEALIPYSPHSLLTREQLTQLDRHKVSATRQDGGLWVQIKPQSTKAFHEIFGFPISVSEDGSTEYYVLEGTPGANGTADAGYMEPAKIAAHFVADPNSGYELKATNVWIPSVLLRKPASQPASEPAQ